MRLKDYFFRWVVAVYALYLFFNKGISYTFLSEVTLLTGIFLVIRERKTFEIVWDKRVKILSLLVVLNFLWMLRGMLQYPPLDVIRDSFIFNYSFLIVIPFLYLERLQEFTNKIFSLYAWLPLVATLSFLLTLLVPSVMQWELFGKIPLFEYKRGDLGVQLLICAVLMLSGKIKLEPRWQLLNIILIGYLFLVVATLNRGGMLSFLVGGALFVYLNRHTASLQQYRFSLRFFPLLLVLVAGMYAVTNIEDTVQGRNSGFGQIGQNVTSIVNRDVEGALSGNIVWRLAWWGTILDYTMAGPYFLQGKGLGINLAIDDGIPLQEDGERALLRSPHNFHLTILARYGVPVFLLWLFFIATLFSPLFKKGPDAAAPVDAKIFLPIFLAMLINATFDVALEGPMSAFPFWLLIGIYLATDYRRSYLSQGS
jgi:O-antigen ligase